MTATERSGHRTTRNRRRWSRYDLEALPSALLMGESTEIECRIENISLAGARLRLEVPPPLNTEIRLNYGHQTAAIGRCAWQGSDSLGISFGFSEESVALALACIRDATLETADDMSADCDPR